MVRYLQCVQAVVTGRQCVQAGRQAGRVYMQAVGTGGAGRQACVGRHKDTTTSAAGGSSASQEGSGLYQRVRGGAASPTLPVIRLMLVQICVAVPIMQ